MYTKTLTNEQMQEFEKRKLAMIEKTSEIVVNAMFDNYHYEQALEILENDDFRIWDNNYTVADIAYDYIHETYDLSKLPSKLKCYIDYESFGRDLLLDGTFIPVEFGYIEIFE